MIDYPALLASLPDPLAEAVLGLSGEPDVERAATLLPPLVGPTFVGDRHVRVKPVVQPDATVAGVIDAPLTVAPGWLVCAPGHPAAVIATGTDAAGRRVTRRIFARHEAGADELWWHEGGRAWCARDGATAERTAAEFEAAWAALAASQAQELAGAAEFRVPGAVVEAARLSLLRALNSFVGDHPKYGWGWYEGPEHDAFPPTILSTVHALCDWGLLERAKGLLAHWLTTFVRADGSFDYYGPSLSEYGMMLDLIERVARLAQDVAWSADAVAVGRRIGDRLVRLYRDRGDLLPGVPEADYHATEGVEQTVYYGNNLWCVRGLLALGSAAAERAYRVAAGDWQACTLEALVDDARRHGGVLPAQRGGRPPERLTADRDASYANYRFYPEMLSSRHLSADQADALFAWREAHGGELCGTTRFADWLDDWPAMDMGLAHLDCGRVTAAQRLFAGHLGLHHAAGHYTVYEQVMIVPDEQGARAMKAGYCVPAQLVTPRLLAHLLVHDTGQELQLNAGCCPAWLAEGFGVQDLPTPYGPVSFHLHSDGDGTMAEVELGAGWAEAPATFLWLPRQDHQPLSRVEINGQEAQRQGDDVRLPGEPGRYWLRGW